MEYKEAKQKFIEAWGILGSNWGINKTMAQIHALLLISPEALTTEEIMEELSISRGNTSMNVRALIDWGIVYKELKAGERKDYFTSEKDIWELAKHVLIERRKRELEPLFRVLGQIDNVVGENKNEVKELTNKVKEIEAFAIKTDKLLNKISSADSNWFFNKLIKMMK